MTHLGHTFDRLARSLWDARAMPRKEDVRALLESHTMTKTVTPADMWKYKGWETSADYSHPSAAFTWTAVSPDFDVDMIDGEFVPMGGHVHAETYGELLVEIEDAIGGAA